MHIIFGGAFNGKRRYVKETFVKTGADWHEGELPSGTSDKVAVVAGVEHWLKLKLSQGLDEEDIRQEVLSAVDAGQIWILTDMNRGIVPADPLERKLRDVIGRLYQQLFKDADKITRIWYGIPQTIKGADGYENLHKNR
ncbi:MAG TPA: bifunctional adenosylcobinamide kinase/adenosylcobinamide-phosphate guanylyltransferase [Planococcus sp. (in: firmicutes)]|nr:bifunctional adenosylcobinamide kinase/adenosylcobinamide-phosphate guanylyltransferase [Planococcus sp. (in: firmicutes)]